MPPSVLHPLLSHRLSASENTGEPPYILGIAPTTSRSHLVLTHPSPELSVLDAGTLQLVRTLVARDDIFNGKKGTAGGADVSAVCAPGAGEVGDGAGLWSAGKDGRLRQWDLRTGGAAGTSLGGCQSFIKIHLSDGVSPPALSSAYATFTAARTPVASSLCFLHLHCHLLHSTTDLKPLLSIFYFSQTSSYPSASSAPVYCCFAGGQPRRGGNRAGRVRCVLGLLVRPSGFGNLLFSHTPDCQPNRDHRKLVSPLYTHSQTHSDDITSLTFLPPTSTLSLPRSDTVLDPGPLTVTEPEQNGSPPLPPRFLLSGSTDGTAALSHPGEADEDEAQWAAEGLEGGVGGSVARAGWWQRREGGVGLWARSDMNGYGSWRMARGEEGVEVRLEGHTDRQRSRLNSIAHR